MYRNLARIGVLATCNAGGAGKWTAEHSAFLRGRCVIVAARQRRSRAQPRPASRPIAPRHRRIGADRRIARPARQGGRKRLDCSAPDAREPSDIAALERLADAAPVWTPAAAVEPGPILTCLADVEPRPVSWLWPGRIPLGRITLLVGRPGEGKSFLTTDAAARVTTGTPWPDGSDCPQGSVILISAEDDPGDTIRPQTRRAPRRRAARSFAVSRAQGR